MVDYAGAFEKPFTDIEKLLLGILFDIIPIINLLSFGYEIKCSGVGKEKPSKKMPEWNNFGRLFLNGLLALIIILIYLIPAAILLALCIGPTIVDTINTFPPTMLQDGTIAHRFISLGQYIHPEPFEVPCLCALLLVALALYLLPAAILRYIENERFKDIFDFRKIFRVAFKGNYLLTIIVTLVLWLILTSLLRFIPFLGCAIASFISGVIGLSLFGQAYLENSKKK